MIRLCISFFVAVLMPAMAAAQNAEESGGGFLERLLEDSLSGAGREVTVTGFQGALGGRAQLESLTIADASGIWFTLRDAVLDWDRGALLRGRLQVTELTAAEIEFPRLPERGRQLPSPEASEFQLPDLPVSVDIGRIAAGRVVLGEALFGAAATVALDGALALDGGEGNVRLGINRIDGVEGRLSLDMAYANEDAVLRLDMALDEAPDGIVANLADLPGRPSVSLTAAGDAPISDFTARIALATDGEDRLAGTIGSAASVTQEGGTDRRFRAAIGGDIAPLFAPDYRQFFGPDIRLSLAGTKRSDGRLEIDDFTLAARALSLAGKVMLVADGTPALISVAGRVADPGGAPVLLPLRGPRTEIGRAMIDLTFDAAAGEDWTGRVAIDELRRRGFSAERLALDGTGRITRLPGPAGAPETRATAAFDFNARALDFADREMTAAVGEAVTGRAELDWREGAPLDLNVLRVVGESYEFDASGRIDGLASDLAVSGSARARADDLSVFSGVAGRPLAGSVELSLAGSGDALTGAFDISADGGGRDLSIGQKRIDGVLAGPARIVLRATRDETGTAIERLAIETPVSRADLSARLRTGDSNVALSAELTDLGAVIPELSGALSLNAEGRSTGGGWRYSAAASGPSVAVDMAGTISDIDASPEIRTRIDMSAEDLSVFSTLAGRPLAGAVTLGLTGRATADGGEIDLSADGTARGLRVGIAEIDPLLEKEMTFLLDGSRSGETAELRRLSLESSALSLGADGRRTREGGAVSFEARVADISQFSRDLTGPATLGGIVAQQGGGDFELDLTGTGAGGIAGTVTGRVAPDGGSVDLNIAGRLPLALANRRIAPRSVNGNLGFDLSVAGPARLSSVSGRLTASAARLADPTVGIVLEDIAFNSALANSRAEISLTGAVRGGGGISVAGPVSLEAPYAGSLTAELVDVALSDPELFDTTLSGRVLLNGPMAGGATIGGRLVLGPTEARIPASGFGSTGQIPPITHLNEPADVLRTRMRAGLAGGDAGQAMIARRAFPLDLTIVANNQIFIRGRGLEAELGGELRLAGTTDNVVPSGQFDLIRGRLDILGKRLTLDEGLVQLRGALDPYLRLSASTQSDDVTVRIVIEGTADDPEIRFLSEPELPEDEVLALLLFGRGIENISPFQAAQLASAVATLSGSGGADIVGRLRQNFGLDDLDVTTEQDGATTVRLGKYISDNVYTDIQVGSDGESEINLNLDISRSVTVTGSVDNAGETSLGIFFERDY